MATNPYIGQARLSEQVKTDTDFEIGDIVRWKSSDENYNWTVKEILDFDRFTLIRDDGVQWNIWKKWFVKVN